MAMADARSLRHAGARSRRQRQGGEAPGARRAAGQLGAQRLEAAAGSQLSRHTGRSRRARAAGRARARRTRRCQQQHDRGEALARDVVVGGDDRDRRRVLALGARAVGVEQLAEVIQRARRVGDELVELVDDLDALVDRLALGRRDVGVGIDPVRDRPRPEEVHVARVGGDDLGQELLGLRVAHQRDPNREQVDPAAHAVGVAGEDLADAARVVAQHLEQLVAVSEHRPGGRERWVT